MARRLTAEQRDRVVMWCVIYIALVVTLTVLLRDVHW